MRNHWLILVQWDDILRTRTDITNQVAYLCWNEKNNKKNLWANERGGQKPTYLEWRTIIFT